MAKITVKELLTLFEKDFDKLSVYYLYGENADKEATAFGTPVSLVALLSNDILNRYVSSLVLENTYVRIDTSELEDLKKVGE